MIPILAISNLRPPVIWNKNPRIRRYLGSPPHACLGYCRSLEGFEYSKPNSGVPRLGGSAATLFATPALPLRFLFPCEPERKREKVPNPPVDRGPTYEWNYQLLTPSQTPTIRHHHVRPCRIKSCSPRLRFGSERRIETGSRNINTTPTVIPETGGIVSRNRRLGAVIKPSAEVRTDENESWNTISHRIYLPSTTTPQNDADN